MTVVGTRPEIIRLSRVLARLDELCDHVLVHTGQNYDYELNQVFFDDLGVRKPDVAQRLCGSLQVDIEKTRRLAGLDAAAVAG